MARSRSHLPLPAVMLMVISCSIPLQAQHPALLTESATTLGADHSFFGLGAEYLSKQSVEATDDPRTLLRLLTLAAHIGVAQNVDFNLDWVTRLIGTRTDGSGVSDWGDLRVSTTIMAVREELERPALGLRTTVKLPNTSYLPAKLGSDQTDFYVFMLASKVWTPVEARLNLGIGILGNPRETGSQDDLYIASGAVVIQLSGGTKVFAEGLGYMGYEGDDKKILARAGLSQEFQHLLLHIYGSARLSGSNRDFGASFTQSEDWSAGFMISREIRF